MGNQNSHSTKSISLVTYHGSLVSLSCTIPRETNGINSIQLEPLQKGKEGLLMLEKCYPFRLEWMFCGALLLFGFLTLHRGRKVEVTRRN